MIPSPKGKQVKVIRKVADNGSKSFLINLKASEKSQKSL